MKQAIETFIVKSEKDIKNKFENVRIKDLIRQLQRVAQKYGDLPVVLKYEDMGYDYADGQIVRADIVNFHIDNDDDDNIISRRVCVVEL